MNIQIRRNTSISFSFKTTEENKQMFKKLIEQSPKLTKEQQTIFDEHLRKRKELERRIWEYLKEHPTKDLDGNLITEETHEIGYDVANEKINGISWAVATQIYIRPKISCYEIKGGKR